VCTPTHWDSFIALGAPAPALCPHATSVFQIGSALVANGDTMYFADSLAIRDCIYRYCRGIDRADEAAGNWTQEADSLGQSRRIGRSRNHPFKSPGPMPVLRRSS
jgi:hypothetical protein